MMMELGGILEKPWSSLPKPHHYSDDCDCDCDDDEYEYEILGEISRGSYGVVYRALDKKTNAVVAMKEEVEGLSPTTITEIETLESLGPHPCVVSFKRVAMSDHDYDSPVYVVMEHMKSDLKRWRETTGQPYALPVVKYIVGEILTGVAFLHDRGFMHRDLKPANVLIGFKGEVKICDFGLAARFGGPARNYSPEVGTLWYKAPELLKGARRYTCEVDMWAVGCIMAELLMDDVIFRGTSESDQLNRIHRVLIPPYTLLRHKVAEAAESSEAAAALTPAGLDLLQRLLEYEPEYRITARDALSHAWFRETK